MWGTEPWWAWRTVVVLWWLVVAGALISLVSAVGTFLVNL